MRSTENINIWSKGKSLQFVRVSVCDGKFTHDRICLFGIRNKGIARQATTHRWLKKTINFRRRMKSDPNNNEQQPTKAGHVIFHSQMIPLLSHVTFMLKWLGHLKNWSINLASVSLLLDSFQVEEVFSLSALLVVSSSKQHHLCKRNVAVNYADCNNLCYPSNKFRTMWEPPFWINCRAKRFPLLWLYFEPHYVIHRCDFLVSIHVLPVFFSAIVYTMCWLNVCFCVYNFSPQCMFAKLRHNRMHAYITDLCLSLASFIVSSKLTFTQNARMKRLF